jgi:hypothetical protein
MHSLIGTPEPGVVKKNNSWLKYGLMGIGILALGLNLLTGITIVHSYDTDIAGVESNVIYTLQKTMDGGPIYTNPEMAPYAITQYSPLYYVLVSEIAKTMSLTPGQDIYAIYKLGRFTSFCLSLLAAILVYSICFFQLRLSAIVSFYACVLTILIPIPWYFLARPDSLASFLTILSICLFIQYLNGEEKRIKKNRLFLLLSAFAGVLAIYSKQSAVITLVAISSYLLITGRYRDLLLLTGGSAVFCCLFLLMLDSASIRMLYSNVVKGVDNGISLMAAYVNVYQIYFSEFIPFITLWVCLVFLYNLYNKGSIISRKPINFLVYACILHTAFGLFTAIKVGSAIAYLFDSLILGLICIAFFYDHFTKKPLVLWHIHLFVVVPVLLFVTNQSFHLFRSHSLYYVVTYALGKSSQNSLSYERIYNQQEVISFLRSELSGSNYLFFSTIRNLNVHLYNHCIFPQYDIARISHERSVFNFSGFSHEVEKGRVRFLIFRENDSFDQLAGVDLKKFTLYKQMQGCSIYINTAAD